MTKIYKNIKTNEIKIVFDDDFNDSDYIELKANTKDAAVEKHVPVYNIENNKINVKVGEVPHPMTQEHYIEWICYVYNNNYKIEKLNPGDDAKKTFDYISDGEVYAYCNLHSLWKNDIKK